MALMSDDQRQTEISSAAKALADQQPSARELGDLAEVLRFLRMERERGDRIEVVRRSRGEDHIRLVREGAHRVLGPSRT